MRGIVLAVGLVTTMGMPAVAMEPSAAQAAMLAEVEDQLPVRINDWMVLDSISFAGTKLVYHYRVDSVARTDGAAYREQQLATYCDTLRSMYVPGELTAIEHDFRFAGDVAVTFGITMEECNAPDDAARAAFFQFAREQSGI